MLPARINLYTPSPDLRELVDCYQSVEIDLALPRDFVERVIPTPRYSLIFQFADSYAGCHAARPQFRDYPRNLIATPVEYPVTVRPTGRTDAFRVALHPHTVERVLKTAASNVRNFVPDMADVFGRDGRDMLERMAEASSTEQRIAIFERWLRKHVEDNRASRFSEMEFAVRRLTECAGQVRIRTLADEMGISERQLERWFLRSVGLRPKFFQRVVRVNAVLREVRHEDRVDWASLASQFGFADQSHMVRDFVALTGEPPAAYLRNVRVMRAVFEQTLAARVLHSDELCAKLPSSIVARLASSRLADAVTSEHVTV